MPVTPKFFLWFCLREVPRLCDKIMREKFRAVFLQYRLLNVYVVKCQLEFSVFGVIGRLKIRVRKHQRANIYSLVALSLAQWIYLCHYKAIRAPTDYIQSPHWAAGYKLERSAWKGPLPDRIAKRPHHTPWQSASPPSSSPRSVSRDSSLPIAITAIIYFVHVMY